MRLRRIRGFTLIEILTGILITSMVLIGAFSTLTYIGASKVRLIENSTIKKQSFYMGEKFFDLIKKGGNIDYEEYWNRSSFDTTNYASGHYQNDSGFGNFGAGGIFGTTTYGGDVYYCLSPNGSSMGTGGCLNSNNNSGASGQRKQRYGQYAEQFIDRNSDMDGDSGDEDGDGNLVGDDDDYYLGIGPRAFSGSKVQELYLIHPQTKERTLFRLNVIRDSYAPSGASCNGTKTMSGSGCLGNIQMLKLIGRDAGVYHNSSGSGFADGKIDTWLIHPDFDTVYGTGTIYGTNTRNYWQNIFPDTVHVSNVEFHLYPNKDEEYSWRDTDANINIAPYVQIHMTLEPSWKLKRQMKGAGVGIDLTTTISLSDILLK